MKHSSLVAVTLLAALAGCGRVSDADAHRLVERYNRVVAEAYRRGDIRLIDAVVGPNTADGSRLTGLIGVRLDMGITLDARLLSLEVVAVVRRRDELHVRTRERWRYRDLRVGTGEQVGEESTDSYEMLYVFRKTGSDWLVAETRFTSPPQVGRQTVPWGGNAKLFHGAPSAPPQPGVPTP